MKLRLRILDKAEADVMHRPYNLGLAVFMTVGATRTDPYHETVILEAWEPNTKRWEPVPIGYAADWDGDRFLGQTQ